MNHIYNGKFQFMKINLFLFVYVAFVTELANRGLAIGHGVPYKEYDSFETIFNLLACAFEKNHVDKPEILKTRRKTHVAQKRSNSISLNIVPAPSFNLVPSFPSPVYDRDLCSIVICKHPPTQDVCHASNC